MLFLVIRLIFIITLIVFAFLISDDFFNLLSHTFIRIALGIILLYGCMLSLNKEKKAWGWIFGITAFMHFVYTYKNLQFSFAGSPEHFYLLTALLLFVSLFTVKDEKNELLSYLVINKAFYLFVALFIALNFSVAGINYRWEEIDDLNFCIDDHQYVIEGDFYSYCDDLQECGWQYYRDRLTGLTKAKHDDYDPPYVIYEDKTRLPRIENIFSSGLFLIMVSTVGSFVYYINISNNKNE